MNEIRPMNNAGGAGKPAFSSYINGKVGQALVGNVISDQAKSDRFKSSLITLVSMSPQIRKCDYASIISSALQAEALNLPLNNQMGFAYIVPYKDKATFQVG